MPKPKLRNPMGGFLRLRASAVDTGLAMLGLAFVFLLSGCGNFWQNPYGSSGGSTATTTTLSSSDSSVAVGTDVTLTATVTPTAATGTVTFYDNSTSMGTSQLSSGTATLTTSFTSSGSASLTATYGGDDTYASSTSDAITVTVTASAIAGPVRNHLATAKDPAAESTAGAAPITVRTSAHLAAPIRATKPFRDKDGTFTAHDAEAVVVEGDGDVNLTGTKLSGGGGNGRGILVFRRTTTASSKTSHFTMTGGSIRYACNAAETPRCAQGSTSREQNAPATVFSVANANAAIALTDVTVTNDTGTDSNEQGTLLTAAALKPWGADGKNGGQVNFKAEGTMLKGDVVVDSVSSAAISVLGDSWGRGSTLEGAINRSNTGKAGLRLDAASRWMVTGNSYLTDLAGLDLSGASVNNIDGGGHCVFYSGRINGAAKARTYSLQGGGFLAPAGTTGLACQ